MSRKLVFLLVFVMLASILSACGNGDNAAAVTVENYLAALADKDDALLVSYVCPDFEFDALLEFDAFSIVQTSLKDVSCQEISNQDSQADVVCQGSIEATYGNEFRSFDLSRRTYHLAEQDGTWLVCGYDDAN
ncbi:hypothetical protein KQH54_04120 [bacterium]|nr:hypothetical protein [bacterium]